jgi:hypothetical protein
MLNSNKNPAVKVSRIIKVTSQRAKWELVSTGPDGEGQYKKKTK